MNRTGTVHFIQKAPKSKAPQKINDLLLLLPLQPVELINDVIGLASFATVFPDGVDQIGRSSVMKEEDALAEAPERSGSELVGAGAALRNAVGEAFAHVVDEEIGEKIDRLIRKRRTRTGRGTARNHWPGGERGGVAVDTADGGKGGAPLFAGRCGGSGSRRR